MVQRDDVPTDILFVSTICGGRGSLGGFKFICGVCNGKGVIEQKNVLTVKTERMEEKERESKRL